MATSTWRKTKAGEWVVYGEMTTLKHKVGCFVPVTSAKGETKEVQIASLGTPFLVAGHYMVYGYVAKTTPPAKATRRVSNGRCQLCFSSQPWNCGCDHPATAH